MNRLLLPGKGFQAALTEEFIAWMTATMAEVEMAFGSEAAYVRPDEVREQMQLRLGRYDGWEFDEDKFGPRMIAAFALDEEETAEVRVSVIYARGDFRVDVRNWYSPN